MRRKGSGTAPRSRVWEGEPVDGAAALPGGGSARSRADEDGDVLADELERAWYPEDAASQRRRRRAMQGAGGEVAVARARRWTRCAARAARRRRARGTARRRAARTLSHALAARAAALDGVGRARRAHVRPAVAPPRAATRRRPARPPARRMAAERRARHQRVDDATRSRKALGAIADYCDAAGVDQVRLVQCDADVTSDAVRRARRAGRARDRRLRRQRPVAGVAASRRAIRGRERRSS